MIEGPILSFGNVYGLVNFFLKKKILNNIAIFFINKTARNSNVGKNETY